MKTLKMNLTLLIILSSLSGCTYKVSKIASDDDTALGQLSAEQITFQLVSDKVFKNNCNSCHSAAGGNKGGVNLETYQGTKLWISEIRSEVDGKTMPPKTQLSPSLIRLVTSWIDYGAFENGRPSNPIDIPIEPIIEIPNNPKEITFAMVKSVLLEKSCLKCHSNATKNEGDTNLETYANVKAAVDEMYEDITMGYMPQGKDAEGNDAKISAYQFKMFFDWYTAGANEFSTATQNDDSKKD